MNVLTAISKMDKLQSQVNALDKAIFQLGRDKENGWDIRLIEEIKAEMIKELENLKSLLEKTPLVNTRGL